MILRTLFGKKEDELNTERKYLEKLSDDIENTYRNKCQKNGITCNGYFGDTTELIRGILDYYIIRELDDFVEHIMEEIDKSVD